MTEQPVQMHTRRALPMVLDRMADDPVVLIEGPRTVGKSTLPKAVNSEADCEAGSHGY